MENLLQVKFKYGVKNRALSFVYTSSFCIAIAALLFVLGVSSSMGPTTVLSLCIGWSIHLTFVIFGEAVDRLLPPYLAPIPQTAVGLLFGLVAAGSIIHSQAFYFFADNYSTLIIGVFFGILGFVISASRTRLLAAQAELAQAETRRQAQEKLLLETELKLLQAQIEPHFLFNTLSNIVGLIRKEPDAAEQTLLNLTTLLRSSLKRTRAQSVTLGEEFTIVKAYLEIQAIRMQGRLHYEFSPQQWAKDKVLSQCPLPPLLIQPLVENAIKHGIDPCEAGGNVVVTAQCNNDELHITVADTGLGINTHNTVAPAANKSGNGTGLSNVRNRLKTLYGGKASMSISDNSPTGLIVTLTIPRAQ